MLNKVGTIGTNLAKNAILRKYMKLNCQLNAQRQIWTALSMAYDATIILIKAVCDTKKVLTYGKLALWTSLDNKMKNEKNALI